MSKIIRPFFVAFIFVLTASSDPCPLVHLQCTACPQIFISNCHSGGTQNLFAFDMDSIDYSSVQCGGGHNSCGSFGSNCIQISALIGGWCNEEYVYRNPMTCSNYSEFSWF